MLVSLPQDYPLKVSHKSISDMILSLHMKYCTLKKKKKSLLGNSERKIENKSRINSCITTAFQVFLFEM